MYKYRKQVQSTKMPSVHGSRRKTLQLYNFFPNPVGILGWKISVSGADGASSEVKHPGASILSSFFVGGWKNGWKIVFLCVRHRLGCLPSNGGCFCCSFEDGFVVRCAEEGKFFPGSTQPAMLPEFKLLMMMVGIRWLLYEVEEHTNKTWECICFPGGGWGSGGCPGNTLIQQPVGCSVGTGFSEEYGGVLMG